MYKKLLLICFVLLLCGCKRLDENVQYIEFVNNCFSDKHMSNDVSLGYQYYVPRGVRKVHDYDYNQVFFAYDSFVYLYVDIISYYYQKELQYMETGNEFYFEKIYNNGKNGYLKIDKNENDYLVTIVYHYSKIEVSATEENLNKMITVGSIILNSIHYNDVVIKKVLEGNLGEFAEFTYEVDKPEGAGSNFSQFLEEYVQKEEKKEEELPDE